MEKWPKLLLERKLVIKNNSSKYLRVYVNYQTYDSSNRWNFYGSTHDGSSRLKGKSWLIAPGKSTYLKDGSFTVRGYHFNVYAKPEGSKNLHYPKKSVFASDQRWPTYYSDNGNFESMVYAYR